MTKQHILGLTLLLLLLFSGCSGSEPSAGVAAAPPDGTATAPAASETISGDVTVPEINEDSPIEALLGIPVFDDDAMNSWIDQLDVERRRLTAECMLAQGFEYSQELPKVASTFETDLAVSSREYAATHGFGIVDSFNASEYDPDLDYVSENARILAEMTEQEREAYRIALWGTNVNEFSESFDDLAGCEGDAMKEAFSAMALLEELGPTADEYYEMILSDNRSVAIYDQWSSCMAQSGYTIAHPDDVREEIYDRLFPILDNEENYVASHVQPDTTDEGLGSRFRAGDFFGPHPKLTDSAQVVLDQLHADEIATAVAHWDCHELIAEEELAIQREYETKFATDPAVIAAAAGRS